MTRDFPDDDASVVTGDQLAAAFREHQDDPDRVAAIVEKVLAQPEAEELYFVGDVLADLAELYSMAGRPEEAIATHERAMAAGYDAIPDPQMDLARYLARAGRKEDARKIHEEVAARDPDDVWFYNAAGFDEVEIGDHERAARLFGAGIERCLARDDPEGLLAQLVDLRRESLEALERPADEVQERARSALGASSYAGPLGIDVWDHFGSIPASTAVVAFFPREELAAALERWPRLRERFGTGDHRTYAHRLQGRLIDTQRVLGRGPALAPITIEGLVELATRKGQDPEHPVARRAWAAELERRGEVLAWPPGRNAPCWCGSETKYKRCCAAVAQCPEDRREQDRGAEPIPVYYELEVSLLRIETRVWRRFQLPSNATFLDLHQAIQSACGWEDAHLFAFEDVEGRDFAPESSLPREARPAAARLSLGSYFSAHSRCTYIYDYGDNWTHEVVLRARATPTEAFGRRLIGGQRAFPPEDCGGLPGYLACVEAAAGGEDPKERREWLGDWDPETFDLEALRARFDR